MSDRLKPLSQICSAIRVIPIRPGFVVFTVLKMNEKKNSNIRNNGSKSDNRKAMILLVKLAPEIDILSDILKCFTTLDCNVGLTIQL